MVLTKDEIFKLIEKTNKEIKALEIKALEQRAAVKVYSQSVRLRQHAQNTLQGILNKQAIKKQLVSDLYKMQRDVDK